MVDFSLPWLCTTYQVECQYQRSDDPNFLIAVGEQRSKVLKYRRENPARVEHRAYAYNDAEITEDNDFEVGNSITLPNTASLMDDL